ncbi:MAG TPA: DUF4956 domain-containing protein [Gemmatimonadales bacterium]|jgi:hypothetical protein|nr:DUF4956 domain-containing protein [Gemmatimonadales bacterium]
MPFFSKMMDLATGGSESPVRRLLVYYVFIVAITVGLLYIFPAANLLFSGERLTDAGGPQVLTDGLHRGAASIGIVDASALPPRLYMVITTFAVMLGTLVLMLPVSWVYMATRRSTGYVQSIVHTMLILPIVVAGIVLIVRNSLALAFSLAGIVAGVRFRANLKDNRDTVFIFLAIGVGLAAGVQALTVAAILSLVFNFTILLVWRTDFGRSPLDLAQKVEWSEPLSALVDTNDGTPPVPDRDLLLTLTPEKADALADRFNRVRNMLAGDRGKKTGKPRYNAVLSVSASDADAAKKAVEPILQQTTKRFRLDDVVSPEGKPSTLYYLVRLRKEPSQDDVLHAIMNASKDCVLGAEFEVAKDLEKEKSEV